MPKDGSDPLKQEEPGLQQRNAGIHMGRRLEWKQQRREGSFRDPELGSKLAH